MNVCNSWNMWWYGAWWIPDIKQIIYKIAECKDFTGNDMESAQGKKSFHECWYAFLVAGANKACSSLCAEDVKCKEGSLEFSLVVVVNMVIPEMLPEI